MKRKSLSVVLVCFFVGFVGFKGNLSNGDNLLAKSLRLASVENLAFGQDGEDGDDNDEKKKEYKIGFPGTNWEQYTITCTYTKNEGTGIAHVGPLSFGYESPITVSYTVKKDVCGSGKGLCLSEAGC